MSRQVHGIYRVEEKSRMGSGLSTLLLALALLVCNAFPAWAESAKPDPDNRPAPEAVTEDAVRLLQLGQLYMGRNNPNYSLQPEKLDFDTRNSAAAQARRIFQQVTTRFPRYGDGWLWLGISLTETLAYSKKKPEGEPVRVVADLADGVQAFRRAYESKTDDIVYAMYYGEALMTCSGDFDGARVLWSEYLKSARTDMQRVTALTQAARACVNKAYFGKVAKKISVQQARQLFGEAEAFALRAAGLCPQAPDVKAMKALLEKHRDFICGQ